MASIPAVMQGQYGLVLTLTVKENGVVKNISTYTTRTLRYRKPDGSTIEVSMSFVTDGSDGKVTYTFPSGALDDGGSYSGQLFLSKTNVRLPTSKFSFTVNPSLPPP